MQNYFSKYFKNSKSDQVENIYWVLIIIMFHILF